MRKIEFAEVILSLAADRERADAIAGDLLEESRGRAPRFWWLVAQTSFLQTGRQLSAAPFGMLRAGMLALLTELGMILLGSVAPGIMGAMNVIHPFFLPAGQTMTAWSWALGVLIVPFMIGRWMARRYPGHEGSVIASLLCLHAILGVCMSVVAWEFMRTTAIRFHASLGAEILIGFAWFVLFAPISILVTASGAVFARYISLRGAAHA